MCRRITDRFTDCRCLAPGEAQVCPRGKASNLTDATINQCPFFPMELRIWDKPGSCGRHHSPSPSEHMTEAEQNSSFARKVTSYTGRNIGGLAEANFPLSQSSNAQNPGSQSTSSSPRSLSLAEQKHQNARNQLTWLSSVKSAKVGAGTKK